MIDRAVADHLEILRLMLRRRIRVGLVERVSHAHALNRLLWDAVDHFGSLNAGGFKEGRHNVNDVVELRADAADIRGMARPRYGHALPGPAEMRRYLLGPLERGVKRPRPSHRHVRIGLVRAPILI